MQLVCLKRITAHGRRPCLANPNASLTHHPPATAPAWLRSGTAAWSTTAAIPSPRAVLLRRALLRQGSAMPGFSPVLVGQRCWKSQRSACISQSAGALSPKTRLASPRAGGLACPLSSPPSRAPRPCAGPRTIVASWPRSRPARPVTSALRGPRPAQAHDGHLRRALPRWGASMPG
jgi:hypothetical protein